jgi:hypothetical protein
VGEKEAFAMDEYTGRVVAALAALAELVKTAETTYPGPDEPHRHEIACGEGERRALEEALDALRHSKTRQTRRPAAAQPPVVRLPTLGDFEGEVPAGSVVRLVLAEKPVTRRGAGVSILYLEVALSLQGVNDAGEIAWLHQSHEVFAPNGKPAPGFDSSLYEAMFRFHDLVRDYLVGRGYRVRNGSYGIPRDVQPLGGCFEVVEWRRGDDGTVAVSLAGEDVSADVPGHWDRTE